MRCKKVVRVAKYVVENTVNVPLQSLLSAHVCHVSLSGSGYLDRAPSGTREIHLDCRGVVVQPVCLPCPGVGAPLVDVCLACSVSIHCAFDLRRKSNVQESVSEVKGIMGNSRLCTIRRIIGVLTRVASIH